MHMSEYVPVFILGGWRSFVEESMTSCMHVHMIICPICPHTYPPYAPPHSARPEFERFVQSQVGSYVASPEGLRARNALQQT